MTNNQAIVRVEAATTLPTIAEAMQLAGLFAQSNYFNDAKTAAQCIVKIEYGRELGIGPAAAMMGVHIIEGKPAPSANLMATLIKRSRRYDFRVRPDWDHEHCTIDFYERRELIGTINFTMAQARQIKDRNGGVLADKLNWKNYPQAMLWARAMSAGARAFCADVFGGAPVYTAEELGADEPPMQPGAAVEVNSETGEILTIESTAVEIPQESGGQSPVTAAPKPLEAVTAPHKGNQGTTATAQQGTRVTSDQLAVLRALVAAVGMSDNGKIEYLHKYHATQFGQLTAAEAAACITDLQREADRIQQPVAS